jgi:hypothetical protein
MRRKGFGRQCEEILKNGQRCTAHALTAERREELGIEESAPWLCRIHQHAADGNLSAVQRRAALASGAARRREVEASSRLSGIDPGVTLAQVLEVVRPALTATLVTGEPDYSARLCAAGVLLAAFPRYLRDSPERVNELLRQAIPAEVYDERMEADTVYLNMRHEWDQLDGLGWSSLKGLVVKPYPPFMIGPHEDAVRIQRSRPQPPEDLRERVRRLSSGQHVLERDGDFPLLLDEDDGGLIRV